MSKGETMQNRLLSMLMFWCLPSVNSSSLLHLSAPFINALLLLARRLEVTVVKTITFGQVSLPGASGDRSFLFYASSDLLGQFAIQHVKVAFGNALSVRTSDHIVGRVCMCMYGFVSGHYRSGVTNIGRYIPN